MSTRALYSFIASTPNAHNFNVYKHHDGYPSGAAEMLKKTLDFAWPLPRYESDEFAAAFCAAAKGNTQGGGVRLMPQGNPEEVADENCTDIEYRYEISCPNGVLQVKAYEAFGIVLFSGPFSEFFDWAQKN